MWSLGSQSGDGAVFETLKVQLQKSDSRLLIYDGSQDVSELVTAMGWDFAEIDEYIKNTENKKPVLIDVPELGLLNGAGGLDTYTDMFANNDRIQGGFLANWIDYAIWYPTASENKRETFKGSPRSSNPDLYQLTYSGSWGESVASGYVGLSGILNADRTLQSDAEELKRAYSPVYIGASDLANGKFTIQNRNNFKNIQDNYIIEYTISTAAGEVSKGTVEGLQLDPGQKTEITIDYGSLAANTEYFIDFTVRYKTAPDWADSDLVVTTKQFDITEFASMPKTGDTNTSGGAFTLTMFAKPDVTTSAIDAATGVFYFSNESLSDLNTMFTLSYDVYETNSQEDYVKQDTKEVWKSPGKVSIASGDVSGFSVAAKTKYGKVTVPYSINGVSTGEYEIVLTLTATKDYGDVKQGAKFRYVFNKSSLGEEIPFKMDESRKPVAVVGSDGKPVMDESTYLPVMTGGDPVQEASDSKEIDTSSDKASSFVSIANDKTTIYVNADTGLIEQYTVDGKEILSNVKTDKTEASPIGNLYRNPTGGDLNSEVTNAQNAQRMLTLSKTASNKILPNGVNVETVAADHIRLTMDYVMVSYPYDNFRNASLDTDYTVTYDIYGNGEVVVSVSYSPSLFTGDIPFEISNILSLPSSYSKMSWYGRGPGESYADKVGATRISVYKNINVNDQIEDYLYMTCLLYTSRCV